MTESDFGISLRPVSMSHEMFNDGLYFVEQAKKETHFGDKHRCYRFAVISFASSFEAFINAQLKHALLNKPVRTKEEEEILDYLSGASQNIHKKLFKVIDKLTLLEGLYHQTKGTITNTTKYKKFNEQVIWLRNKIVHYSHGNFSEVYEEQIIKTAENGAQLLRDVINVLEEKLNLLEYQYFDKEHYESII